MSFDDNLLIDNNNFAAHRRLGLWDGLNHSNNEIIQSRINNPKNKITVL